MAYRLTPSHTSNLATLTWIHTNMIQWQRSWLGGKLSRKISTVSTVTINRFFSVCYFFQRHNSDGRPGCTRAIESNHGSENGQTHFAYTGVDKGSNRNRGCKIVFTYDLWISTVLIKDPISFHLYYQLNNHQSNIRFYMSCVK